MIDVAELRRRLADPAALARALGLPARRQRTGVVVRCPWHNERTPSCSMTVGPDGTVRVRCFGCNETGDALTLIQAVHGVDFKRALEIAVDLAGGAVHIAPVQALPPEPARLSDSIFDRICSHLVAPTGDVAAYIRDRRLPTADLYEVPQNFVQRVVADVGRDAWERSGLSWEGRLAYPGHRLAIPWRNPDGLVSTLQRRALGPAERKYVFPTKRSPRWPYGCHLQPSAVAAVAYVEGALDVLALRVIAAREGLDWLVLGVPGVGNWDRSWASFATGRDAIVAFDADDAGDEAAARVAADLRNVATRVGRARPEQHDWCDTLVARERAA